MRGRAHKDRLMAPKVKGLIRVSTLEQAGDDRGGMLRQRQAINVTVERCGLDCVEIVELEGVSGTQVRHNAKIQQLLKEIESREIAGVVVADLDRLMRPATGEDYALLDPFIRAKATVYASGWEFNFGTPAGKLVANIVLGVAGFEREMILMRTQDSIRELCLAGRHPFGAKLLPRGITYDRKAGAWGINEQIAPVLEAFRLIDEEGVSSIAEVSRRTGINERALHNLIRNPLYSGWRVYDMGREATKVVSKNGKPYKRKTPLPEAEVIRVKVLVPAPVTEERFARVQAILEATFKSWHGAREDRPVYNMLRSVAFCGCCEPRAGEPERRLYFSQDLRRPNLMGYYYCKRKHKRRDELPICTAPNQSKADLDAVTAAFITECLTKAVFLRAIIEHSEAAHLANVAQPELAKTDSTTFETRRRRLRDGLEEGLISVAELKERLARIDAEENALKRAVTIQAETMSGPETESLIKRIVKGAAAFRRMTDPAWRLEIIQRMFSAIYYQDGQIVRFKLHPSLVSDAVCEDLLPVRAAAASAMRNGVAPRRRPSASTSTRFPGRCSTASTSMSRFPP
jgi:DNA invertase Pin-like site-specific DNA recombinase